MCLEEKHMDSKAVKHLQRALTLTKAIHSPGNTARKQEKSFGTRRDEIQLQRLQKMKQELERIRTISAQLEETKRLAEHRDVITYRALLDDPDPVPGLQRDLASAIARFNRERNWAVGPGLIPRIAVNALTAKSGEVTIADYIDDYIEKYVKKYEKLIAAPSDSDDD